MVSLHLGLDFFRKQQHKAFVSIIQSIQDDQDSTWWEHVIQQKGHIFPYVYPYRNLLVKQMYIF